VNLAEKQAAATAPFAAHESSFAGVLGSTPVLVKVVDVDAHEGPVYAADEDALYFTTLPQQRVPGFPEVAIKRLALDGLDFPVAPERVTVVRESANAANGMALAPDGRLLVCEQGNRSERARISLVERDSGRSETVVHAAGGLPLNSPNDIVVRRDGTIWFTDPSYGYLQGFRPRPADGDRVYRFDPRSADMSVVAADLDKPNGLAFSPDEDTLYVGDSGANHEPGSFDPRRPHHVRAFDVAGARLANGRLFAVTTPGFPDGITVDSAGRVYVSCFSGVQVFDPRGALIGEIHLPGAVNFTFGGTERNVLFITTDTAVWAAVLEAKGA
jgi:gluconolactonase